MGAQMVALSEGMALAEKCDLDQVTLLELQFQLLLYFVDHAWSWVTAFDETVDQILSLGALCSPLVTGKGSAILESNFPANFPLKHQQAWIRQYRNVYPLKLSPLSDLEFRSRELSIGRIEQNISKKDPSGLFRWPFQVWPRTQMCSHFIKRV